MIRFADIVTTLKAPDPKAPDAKTKKVSVPPADGKPPAARVPAPDTTTVPKAPRKPKTSS